MLKAHRYRINPTNVPQRILRRQFGTVWFVYNHFLPEQQDRYEKQKPHLSFFDLCRELVVLKRVGRTMGSGSEMTQISN